MVDRVRVQRAIVALRITSPKTGSLSRKRSIVACILAERRQVWKKKYSPANRLPKMMYQYLTKYSDSVITNTVGAGRSAPKLENTSLKAGTTQIMITAVTMKATPSTATG